MYLKMNKVSFGNQEALVNAVDVNTGELCYSWLLMAHIVADTTTQEASNITKRVVSGPNAEVSMD